MDAPERTQSGVYYQIYPRSWADADGDGVGDLNGIIARLDHLTWLGVDGVWLNPVAPSPDADWGYDVSDYRGVHPDLGTLADLDRLVEEAHARGLRVLLDLVPNHTSDRHPWFAESRSSRESSAQGLVCVGGARRRRGAAQQLAERLRRARRGAWTRPPASTTSTSSSSSSPT